MTCVDCKFSRRKGHRCEKFFRNVTPSRPSCDAFEKKVEEGKKEESYRVSRFTNIQTNLMYILMRSVEILIYNIDKGLRYERRSFSEKKRKQLMEISSLIGRLKDEFDRLEKDYTDTLTVEGLDILRRDANEHLRLMLLYIDRCSTDKDNSDALFKFLRSLKSDGIIGEEELNNFYEKK